METKYTLYIYVYIIYIYLFIFNIVQTYFKPTSIKTCKNMISFWSLKFRLPAHLAFHQEIKGLTVLHHLRLLLRSLRCRATREADDPWQTPARGADPNAEVHRFHLEERIEGTGCLSGNWRWASNLHKSPIARCDKCWKFSFDFIWQTFDDKHLIIIIPKHYAICCYLNRKHDKLRGILGTQFFWRSPICCQKLKYPGTPVTPVHPMP